MTINSRNNFILVFSTSILLFSCSQKNEDIDLSNLPVIKQKEVIDSKKDNVDVINFKNNEFIEDLVPFKNKETVLSQFKFGKSDPFSKSEYQVSKLSSDFKLTGFLNTRFKKYVFVNYLGNEGTISKNSVGGVNTNLLPKGAKVISIDPKAKRLTINHENENFVFEL